MKLRPYLVLAALQVIDVATTWWLLSNIEHAVEGNPLADALFTTAGLYGGLTFLLAFKLTVVYFMYVHQTGVRIVSAIYGLVAVNNILYMLLWLTS